MRVSGTNPNQVGGGMRFQVRGAGYNVVNHPVFGAPNPQVTHSLFGYIPSQANRPRSGQLMVRMMF